jgi:hypothetical protein
MKMIYEEFQQGLFGATVDFPFPVRDFALQHCGQTLFTIIGCALTLAGGGAVGQRKSILGRLSD